MRFTDYLINEQTQIERQSQQLQAIAGQISRESLPFLQSINPSNAQELQRNMIFRGMQAIEMHTERNVRTNRRPVDMPEQIHKFLDQWFKKHFGVAARSAGLFVTRNADQAKRYGTPYYVFPKGQSRIIASNQVRDLFDMLNHIAMDDPRFTNIGDLREVDERGQRLSQKQLDVLAQAMEEAEYKEYNVTSLSRGGPREVEAVVICDSYHAVNSTINQHLIDHFFESLYNQI